MRLNTSTTEAARPRRRVALTRPVLTHKYRRATGPGRVASMLQGKPNEAEPMSGQSLFLLRPLRQAPGLVAGGAGGGAGRALASLRGRLGAACRGRRAVARDPRDPRRLA